MYIRRCTKPHFNWTALTIKTPFHCSKLNGGPQIFKKGFRVERVSEGNPLTQKGPRRDPGLLEGILFATEPSSAATAVSVVLNFTTSPDGVHPARHFGTHCGAVRPDPAVWFGEKLRQSRGPNGNLFLHIYQWKLGKTIFQLGCSQFSQCFRYLAALL